MQHYRTWPDSKPYPGWLKPPDHVKKILTDDHRHDRFHHRHDPVSGAAAARSANHADRPGDYVQGVRQGQAQGDPVVGQDPFYAETLAQDQDIPAS